SAAAPIFMQCSKSYQDDGKKKNIILILVDDMRFDAMSCLGHPVLDTPNFDHLVNQGTLFSNAFVTTSLCSPSRASILSGLYAHQHQVLDNNTELDSSLPSFPPMLRQRGYRTGFIGKWHMGGSKDSSRPGFDRWVSFRGQGVYFNPRFNVDGSYVEHEGYTTDLLTDYAEEFIRESRRGPFFLYLSHKAVHDDFQPAPRHRGKYRDIKVPYPPSYANTEENYRGKPQWLKRARKSCIGVDHMYDNRYGFEQFYKDYCECLLAVDDSVGRVLRVLEDENLLDDTIILFAGDNGFLCGEHGLIDKRNMYEPSIRIPLIAYSPGMIPRGKTREELALNIDLCPTILELAGAEPLEASPGMSLLGLALENDVPWRKEFLYEYFWERNYPQNPSVLGLRTDRYSYMRYHGTAGANELYDIRRDPHQLDNLLGDYALSTEVRFENSFPENTHPGSRNIPNSLIDDPELMELVCDLEGKLFNIIESTGGIIEPTWSALLKQHTAHKD
ncbi:sulfatase, partial [Gemmatimonadota bacterium]